MPACASFADHEPAVIQHWLAQFFRRFMTQQFKRTTLPPGPKGWQRQFIAPEETGECQTKQGLANWSKKLSHS